MRRREPANAGMIILKGPFVMLLLAVVIHVGIKLVPMYLDAAAMKDEMTLKAGFSEMLRDEEIAAELSKKANSMGLPLGPSNFVLRRDEKNNTLTISTAWEVEVHFFYRDIYVRYFLFQPTVTAAIRRSNSAGAHL